MGLMKKLAAKKLRLPPPEMTVIELKHNGHSYNGADCRCVLVHLRQTWNPKERPVTPRKAD